MGYNGEELFEFEGFEQLLAHGVAAWVKKADRRPRLRIFSSEFHDKCAPPLKLTSFICRIVKYAECSPVCFLVAFALMKRLAARYDEMIPTCMNVHRLVLTSTLLAIKSSEDVHVNNSHFAQVGGLPLAELNKLELDMLSRLNFNLRVDYEEITLAGLALIQEIKSCPPILTADVRQLLRRANFPCDDENRKRPASPSLEREEAPKIMSQESIEVLHVVVR
mmetsp:Transcript_3235/g.9877  ORF Transcript_3235/g.9877 Transcript_3235/m.9877 type:complete len:221 (+) Transcript_3235:135-797(+)